MFATGGGTLTTGRHTGLPRRIEIWMLDVDGRFFITGTPGHRDWLANLHADPSLAVHLNRHARLDVSARAIPVTDAATRRAVLEHLSATWYRTQQPLDELVETAPMVEVRFDSTTPREHWHIRDAEPRRTRGHA
jgi:deazaflavin-dependent oxidoreductase (nitroreductase family)